MKGLLQGAMRPSETARAPMPDQPSAGTGPEPGRGSGAPQPTRRKRSAVDPKSMKPQREVLVNGMLRLLYGPMLEPAAQMLKESAESPQSGVARVLSGVMSAAYQSLEEQGRSVPPAVMFQAGMVGAQAIGEMADGLGVLDQRRDAEVIEAAFMEGLARFGDQNAEQLTDEERQRYLDLIDAFGAEREKALGQNAEARDDIPQRDSLATESAPMRSPGEVRNA